MKWFEEVFLPSLIAEMKVGQSRWITEKQVAVCFKYMEKSRYYDRCFVKVNGLWVIVNRKKKGYGRLEVSDHL